jgi:hypothetical protein
MKNLKLKEDEEIVELTKEDVLNIKVGDEFIIADTNDFLDENIVGEKCTCIKVFKREFPYRKFYRMGEQRIADVGIRLYIKNYTPTNAPFWIQIAYSKTAMKILRKIGYKNFLLEEDFKI